MKSGSKFIITGSLLLTGSNLAVRALSYVYRIIMARLLTPYQYGILNLALPLQFMVIVIASAGIAPSVAKFISEDVAKGGDPAGRASSCIFYYTLFGGVIGLIFLALSPLIGKGVFHDANAVVPLQISALAIPFGIIVSAYTGVFQGQKRIDYMSGVLLLEQSMRVAASVALVVLGYEVVGAIGGSTFGFIGAVPISYFILRRSGMKAGNRDLEVFKEVFYFSIPTSITALSSFLLAYADIILIGFYMAPADVGIYSAASPASRLILAFTMAVYAVLIPTVSEHHARGDQRQIKRYFRTSIAGLGIVVVPATLIGAAFPSQIIGLLFSSKYLDAASSFRILVLGVAALSLFMTNSAIFQGMGRAKTPMRILLVFATLDVLLNIVLIPIYGIEGAALSTALASAGAGLTSTVALAKHLNSIG